MNYVEQTCENYRGTEGFIIWSQKNIFQSSFLNAFGSSDLHKLCYGSPNLYLYGLHLQFLTAHLLSVVWQVLVMSGVAKRP